MKKIILAIILVLFLASCGQQSADRTNDIRTDINIPPAIKTETRQESIPHSVLEKVKIKEFAFQPEVVRIRAGDSVEWEQFDQVPHTVTLVSGPEEFDSGVMRKGDKWVKTFEKRGEYEYKCTPHPNMRGKVIVE